MATCLRKEAQRDWAAGQVGLSQTSQHTWPPIHRTATMSQNCGWFCGDRSEQKDKHLCSGGAYILGLTLTTVNIRLYILPVTQRYSFLSLSKIIVYFIILMKIF